MTSLRDIDDVGHFVAARPFGSRRPGGEDEKAALRYAFPIVERRTDTTSASRCSGGKEPSPRNCYPTSAVVTTGESVQRDLPLNFFMDRYVESFASELPPRSNRPQSQNQAS